MDVLHPWMLAGLAGVLLPLLIHLLARRRLPVIDWGAMQFLQTSPYSRRSLAIDDWLLLILRIAVIVVLVLALARPWIHGSLFVWTNWSPPRDVSVVIDGSFSTAVPNQRKPLQEALRDNVRALLGTLSAGSTVQVFDARDAVIPLLPHRTAVISTVNAALQDLRPPTGSSHLATTILTASRDLLDTNHPHRDVIVFADRQARAWRPDDVAAWTAVDGQLRQAAVPPRVSVILQPGSPDDVNDVGWEQASLSRERLIPGQKVTIRGQLKNWGSTLQQRRVGCVLNGRPIAEQQTTVRVPPSFTTPISFEVRLPNKGLHALSLRSEADALPGNDHVEFITEVVAGVKVLLVDGTPSDDPQRSETFFAKAALDGSQDAAGWVRLTEIPVTEFAAESLANQDVILLANPPTQPKEMVSAVEKFVSRGGAVFITLGAESRTSDAEDHRDWWNWLPVDLKEWHDPANEGTIATSVVSESLTVPWLERFRPEQGGELCDASFRGWWTTVLHPRTEDDTPLVLARFANGDPWLVSARHGRGTVVVATSTLDADGNTLPAKPDYVAWLHELLIAMSEPPQRRNIAVGETMHRQRVASTKSKREWLDPWGTPLPFDDLPLSAMARWPGVYVVTTNDDKRPPGGDPQLLCGTTGIDAFAAQTDWQESDLTPLTDVEMATLTAGRSLRFYDSVEAWQRQQAAEAPRSEFGWSLLWMVLGLLMLESVVTRRRARQSAA